jgi:hypothetical protein
MTLKRKETPAKSFNSSSDVKTPAYHPPTPQISPHSPFSVVSSISPIPSPILSREPSVRTPASSRNPSPINLPPREDTNDDRLENSKINPLLRPRKRVQYKHALPRYKLPPGGPTRTRKYRTQGDHDDLHPHTKRRKCEIDNAELRRQNRIRRDFKMDTVLCFEMEVIIDVCFG